MFSRSVRFKPLIANIVLMHNIIVQFGKILDIFKVFAQNRVTALGNIPRRGVVPKFSDLEIIAFSTTAEASLIDSVNNLFKRLENEKGSNLQNLITRCQYNQHRKLTMNLGRKSDAILPPLWDGREDVFCIIFKPVKVFQKSGGKRYAIGRNDSVKALAWGYCASKTLFYVRIVGILIPV